MSPLFGVEHTDAHSHARTGVLSTPHGTVRTPAFVAVATQAVVKALDPRALADVGIQVAISNSYHLHLRPGEDVIAEMGGLHRFSGWNGPLMTDSGGFQVFSLGAGKEHGVGKVASIFPGDQSTASTEGRDSSLVDLTEEGVHFRSIVDGSPHFFSPENVVELQRKLGADLILVLDECTSPLHDRAYTADAMHRTHRWARRGLDAFRSSKDSDWPNPGQALFGIVQGGAYKELREESTQVIANMPFDGFAIGGSLGRSKQEMHRVLDWTAPHLPDDKPRHLLGIGGINDIFAGVRRGIDTFDCASPTRIARTGSLLVKGERRHRINIKNARFRTASGPIADNCGCPTCRHYSRGYLRHLLRAREYAFYRLATIHNLWFMARLMRDVRRAIAADRLNDLKQEWMNAGNNNVG